MGETRTGCALSGIDELERPSQVVALISWETHQLPFQFLEKICDALHLSKQVGLWIEEICLRIARRSLDERWPRSAPGQSKYRATSDAALSRILMIVRDSLFHGIIDVDDTRECFGTTG